MYPLSLNNAARARAFRANNGELGLWPGDTQAFLAACRRDGVEVLGWELWLIDHAWGPGQEPVPQFGAWCGGIPIRGEPLLSVVGGTGNADASALQIDQFDLSEVTAEWLPYLRVNFTLDV